MIADNDGDHPVNDASGKGHGQPGQHAHRQKAQNFPAWHFGAVEGGKLHGEPPIDADGDQKHQVVEVEANDTENGQFGDGAVNGCIRAPDEHGYGADKQGCDVAGSFEERIDGQGYVQKHEGFSAAPVMENDQVKELGGDDQYADRNMEHVGKVFLGVG